MGDATKGRGIRGEGPLDELMRHAAREVALGTAIARRTTRLSADGPPEFGGLLESLWEAARVAAEEGDPGPLWAALDGMADLRARWERQEAELGLEEAALGLAPPPPGRGRALGARRARLGTTRGTLAGIRATLATTGGLRARPGAEAALRAIGARAEALGGLVGGNPPAADWEGRATALAAFLDAALALASPDTLDDAGWARHGAAARAELGPELAASLERGRLYREDPAIAPGEGPSSPAPAADGGEERDPAPDTSPGVDAPAEDETGIGAGSRTGAPPAADLAEMGRALRAAGDPEAAAALGLDGILAGAGDPPGGEEGRLLALAAGAPAALLIPGGPVHGLLAGPRAASAAPATAALAGILAGACRPATAGLLAPLRARLAWEAGAEAQAGATLAWLLTSGQGIAYVPAREAWIRFASPAGPVGGPLALVGPGPTPGAAAALAKAAKRLEDRAWIGRALQEDHARHRGRHGPRTVDGRAAATVRDRAAEAAGLLRTYAAHLRDEPPTPANGAAALGELRLRILAALPAAIEEIGAAGAGRGPREAALEALLSLEWLAKALDGWARPGNGGGT